jgi:hypothetical protein
MKKQHHEDRRSAVGLAPGADGTGAALEPGQKLDFVADYTTTGVDVLVIGDGSYNAGEIQRRISTAIPALSNHLWNLASSVGSVHVAVLDRDMGYGNDFDGNGGNGGGDDPSAAPIVGEKSPKNAVLAAESMPATDFADALNERLSAMGRRGGNSAPRAVLAAALAESKKPSGGRLSGLFREDAFLAVVMLNGTIADPDPNARPDSVVKQLNARSSGWAASALGIDDPDCMVVGTQPPQPISGFNNGGGFNNGDGFNDDGQNGGDQNGNGGATPPPSPKFVDQALYLAKRTGGAVGSYCKDATYVGFIDDVVTKGTGTEYFRITLDKPIKAINGIVSGGVEVKQYRFLPGSKTLEVSRRIKSGDAFTVDVVSYESEADIPEDPVPVVGVDDTDKVPTAVEKTLSPEETQFLSDVAPAIQRACGNCHFGRPFDSNGGFAAATQYKDDIARRMQLPTDNTQYMPQNNGNISPADKKAILDWAKK